MSDADEKIATTNYRSGKLSSADAGHLAWEILEIYGAEDDRNLHMLSDRSNCASCLRSGGTALEIWAANAEMLALQLFFADREDHATAQVITELLFIIAFSKRGSDEADDLSGFDFNASPWWRNLTNGLRSAGDAWADDDDEQSGENASQAAVGRRSADN